jgi:hypothetical protein
VLKALLVFLLAPALAVVIVVAATISTDDVNGHRRIQLDLDSIFALALAAEAGADAMEAHAAHMIEMSASRLELASWPAEAESLRANAASLRFLASSARNLHHDLATFPITSTAVDLRRLPGNGRNLELFASSILAQADAMDAHVATMRGHVEGDRDLLSTIDGIALDIRAMRATGETALHQGRELADRALTLARSVGVRLE